MSSMPSFKSKLNATLDSWLVPARDDNKRTFVLNKLLRQEEKSFC